MKYDILNSKEEIELNNEKINEKEQKCIDFRLSIPSGRKAGLLHMSFHQLFPYIGQLFLTN